MSRTIYTSKREAIILDDNPFASGGEGAVYKVKSAPSFLKNVCVKIYHSSKANASREKKIKYMVAHPPHSIRSDRFMIGWPLEYVTDSAGAFLGFVMPMGFPGSKELVILTSMNLSKKLDQDWYKRYDRKLGKSSLLSRLKLICNIAIPIHILHNTNKYVLIDFKPQNVLVTKDGRVTIVDMDSIQISERDKLLFPGSAATPDYRPPEFYKKGIGTKPYHLIKPSWDMFSIGVVFYQILFGLHPYTVTPRIQQKDGSNEPFRNISYGLFPFGKNAQLIAVTPPPHEKFKVLPKEFKDLFVSTFTENFANRPDAELWGRLIHQIVTKAEKEITVNEGGNSTSTSGNTHKGNSASSTKTGTKSIETSGFVGQEVSSSKSKSQNNKVKKETYLERHVVGISSTVSAVCALGGFCFTGEIGFGIGGGVLGFFGTAILIGIISGISEK